MNMNDASMASKNVHYKNKNKVEEQKMRNITTTHTGKIVSDTEFLDKKQTCIGGESPSIKIYFNLSIAF